MGHHASLQISACRRTISESLDQLLARGGGVMDNERRSGELGKKRRWIRRRDDPVGGVERGGVSVGLDDETECGTEAAALRVVTRRFISVVTVRNDQISTVRPCKERCAVIRAWRNTPEPVRTSRGG